MAITLTTHTTGASELPGAPFSANGFSAAWSGTEQLVAAATGKTHYITYLGIWCAAADSYTIGAGETGGAVTAVLLGPFGMANATFLEMNLDVPISVGSAVAIVADSAGSGDATIVVAGFTL